MTEGGGSLDLPTFDRLRTVAGGHSVAPAMSTPTLVRNRTSLTEREREVAELVVAGLMNQEIAARLGIAERTVQAHVSSARGKLGARSRTQLAVYVLRLGIVPLEPLDGDGST